MLRRRRRILCVFLTLGVLLSAMPLFAGDLTTGRRGFPETSSAPRLLYPITDKVDLSGKNVLTFKWWSSSGIDHYEWRLFKGYNMFALDLVEKQILPARISSYDVKADVFQDGQVYTWSLIAVSYGGQKSDKNFSSFKVTKT